jgi:peptidyl-prolyl cis-trans isomerase D
MVLSLMRRHAKSWLIKFLIAIIAIVFIFYFGYSFTQREGIKVAYVNGELITGSEYQKAYRELVTSLQRQYQDNWDEDLIKSLNLRRRALDRLIDTKLVGQEARELGLEVTEREIQEAIVKYPAFQVDGNFDMGRYRALLSYNRMEPEDFEADMARQLLDAKMKNFLSAFMTVSEQEVLEQYTYRNEKIKISFVRFAPERFKESIQPNRARIKKFFEEHKEDYRVPEKLKLRYIEIDPAAFRDQVEISETEIQSYYEYNLDSYKLPEEVKARHILFRVSRDAAADEEKKVKAKAEAVLEQARKGRDFAELAKEHSEGPTKSKGGDLGWFSRGKMVKPFEEAVFEMQKGDISDLVRTSFGFHIIKLEDIREARTKSLKEVHDQIRKNLQKQTSTELAHEKGLTLTDQMPYEVDLADYATDNEMRVKETDYFPEDKPIPELGGDGELRSELFMLEHGEATGLVELNEKFYIFQVADRQASYLPELNAVRTRVKADLVAELAAKEAKAAAESYLAELKRGKGWEELAEKKNFEPVISDFVRRRGTVPQIGYMPEMLEAAFKLSRDNLYPEEVFENDRGVFVIRWEARQGIDKENFAQQRDQYRFSLMQARQSRTVADWLENLRSNADIEIVTPVE